MTRLPRLACLLGLLSASTLLAAPIDEARIILADFLAQPSYTWATATPTRGIPETGDEVEEVALGEHERSGYSKIRFHRAPHLAPSLAPAGQAWIGFTDEQGFWGSRWVFDTPEGWKTLGELPRPATGPARPSRGGLSVRVGAAWRTIGVSRPDHEIALVLEHLEHVEVVSPGIYRATIAPAGVAALVAPARPRSPLRLAESVRGARGSIEFRASRGVLADYRLELQADVTTMGQTRHVKRIQPRILKNVGTTQVDVPPDVEKMIRREASAPLRED